MAKKQSYKITMRDGTQQEVQGEVFNEIWGIDKRSVKRGEQTMKDGTVRELFDTHYHITHLPTGAKLPLCTFRTLKSAKMLLSEPEFFIDELSKESVKKMGEAIARFWNWRYWTD